MTPTPNSAGIAMIPLDISNLECITRNSIMSVECTNYEIICRPGDDFFFRLATFGEVYELATRVDVSTLQDGSKYEYTKATTIPCDDITQDPVSGVIDGLYIYNRHMSDFEKLTTYFDFDVDTVRFSTNNKYEDLECTAPVSVLPSY